MRRLTPGCKACWHGRSGRNHTHGRRGSTVMQPTANFRGNKAALPSKPCAVCGLAMTWRRRWAKNWADVKYCSDACRRNKAAHV